MFRVDLSSVPRKRIPAPRRPLPPALREPRLSAARIRKAPLGADENAPRQARHSQSLRTLRATRPSRPHRHSRRTDGALRRRKKRSIEDLINRLGKGTASAVPTGPMTKLGGFGLWGGRLQL